MTITRRLMGLSRATANGAFVQGQSTGTQPTRLIVGPTLPTLPSGVPYVWNKTDATTGDLVDIVTGVAA